MSDSQKIEIQLQSGYKLLAEQNSDPMFKNEIYIGIVDEDGVWVQDLAVVRNSYLYDEFGNIKWKDDAFDVLVYADRDDEDFTDDFNILRRDDL